MAKFDEEPTAHREQCRKWGVKKRHMKIYPHYAIVYCVIAVVGYAFYVEPQYPSTFMFIPVENRSEKQVINSPLFPTAPSAEEHTRPTPKAP